MVLRPLHIPYLFRHKRVENLSGRRHVREVLES